MRELKLKAWDIKSKKMRKVNSIAFNNDGSCKVINLWGYDIIYEKDVVIPREPSEVILLEYTGLTCNDETETEIYQGDIEAGGLYGTNRMVNFDKGIFYW